MKITSHWLDLESGMLKLQLQSENQEESHRLITYANQVKLPVKTYGAVESQYTWLWINIPIKKFDYNSKYFGNDKDVVK